MARHLGPVLVDDTNVILESHRTGAWRALAGAYRVETSEDCVMETQTGFQRRRPEQRIDAEELRKSVAAVHSVAPRDRADLAIRVPDGGGDIGEASPGRTPWDGMTPGCCAAPTRPVFAAASGWGFENGWCRWKGFSTMPATGRAYP